MEIKSNVCFPPPLPFYGATLSNNNSQRTRNNNFTIIYIRLCVCVCVCVLKPTILLLYDFRRAMEMVRPTKRCPRPLASTRGDIEFVARNELCNVRLIIPACKQTKHDATIARVRICCPCGFFHACLLVVVVLLLLHFPTKLKIIRKALYYRQ